jgi:hypothetical protein
MKTHLSLLLKKLEIYKTHPELFSTYSLDEITHIHEEQSDFITIAHKQCSIWRAQSLLAGQIEKINGLEEIIKKLETAIYHILFIIEYIQRNKNFLLDFFKLCGFILNETK